jgi:hypothetical protein
MKSGFRYSSLLTVVLSCLFFLSTQSIQAQYDSVTVSDTVVQSDTYEVSTESTVEDETSHFLPRSYGDSVVNTRNLPADAVRKMKEDDEFWYANVKVEKAAEEERSVPLGQRKWFTTLIWMIIIGGFIGFVIWYLASSNVGLFRKKIRSTGYESEQEDEISEDIFAINYQREIDKAAQQGNYRLAVRLMFLRLLKNMSERNLISYKQDRTNFDYLLQLSATRYYQHFFRITRNYEYSWYGKFDVSQDAFHVIKKDFDHFNDQMK